MSGFMAVRPITLKRRDLSAPDSPYRVSQKNPLRPIKPVVRWRGVRVLVGGLWVLAPIVLDAKLGADHAEAKLYRLAMEASR